MLGATSTSGDISKKLKNKNINLKRQDIAEKHLITLQKNTDENEMIGINLKENNQLEDNDNRPAYYAFINNDVS